MKETLRDRLDLLDSDEAKAIELANRYFKVHNLNYIQREIVKYVAKASIQDHGEPFKTILLSFSDISECMGVPVKQIVKEYIKIDYIVQVNAKTFRLMSLWTD